MNQRIRHTLLLCVVMASALAAAQASAQRRISPVRPATGVNLAKEVTDSLNNAALVETIDDQGRTVLVDTITGTEQPDTLGVNRGSIPKMLQPLIFSATAGLDIWDPVMRLFGQKYGLGEVSLEFNMHNRYIPVVEIGIGQTDYTPARQNYTYKVNPTPYFRIGANYNFLYNSNPDYMAYAGLRFGFSSFNYNLNGVTVSDGYWGETTTMDFPRQHCSLVYMNLLFGIRVKIAGPVSLGWQFRFKTRLHESKAPMGKPWYIPGFGTRGGSIAGSFSVFYTFRFAKPRPTGDRAKRGASPTTVSE